MRPIKVGIVCYPTTGGSGVVATELGKEMAARGHHVHMISHGLPARISHFAEHLFFHKIDSGDYPLFGQFNPYSLSVAVKIREVADKFDLDIVHAHYAIPYATCAYLAREMLRSKKRLYTITTLHGTDITLVGVMPSFHEITRFSLSVCDAVTAVSRFLREETLRTFHIDKDIAVIPNFVDCNEFRPVENNPLREKLAPAGERVIMHVSNFRKVKNLPVALKVFCEVRKALPVRLVLVGDGPERESTERLADEMGLGGEVLFMGEAEFTADLLPTADLFLLPSKHESFGLAALEAMSCGVPVVASRIGGIHEVVEEGVCGYLYDPDDVAGMAERIAALLKDEAARREMGLKGRERARKLFGKDKVIEAYENLYVHVMEGR